MNAPTRPILRWHGGKWRLAPWIISHFPAHRVYVEPFGGAGSVLLRKERSYAEIYNDLDDDVVTLFQILRDRERAARLIELVRLTPFARREFQLAYEVADDPMECARRLLVRAAMGFGSNAHAWIAGGYRRTGFRSKSLRAGGTPALEWSTYPDAVPAIIDRLQGVNIEHRDAFEVLEVFDEPDTLFYIDPPYLAETRAPGARSRGELRRKMYRHELSDAQHAELLERLLNLAGMVVLSGYASPLYDEALRDWGSVETQTHADGALDRTEVLWLNPACAAALERERAGHGMPLFGAPA